MNTKHLSTNLSLSTKTIGFTVIELLVAIAILAILAGVAIPSMQSLFFKTSSEASANQIAGLVRYARNEAVFRNTSVTLCPSSDGISCTNAEWQGGVLLFTDRNQNSKIDDDDTVKRFVRPFLNTGSLRWRSLRNKVQFNSRGMARGTIGSFVYCPENNDASMGASLVLSLQGRLRKGLDTDKNGIPETGSHKDIICG